MSEKIKKSIRRLFEKMRADVDEIVETSPSFQNAAVEISEFVSARLAAAVPGYITDIDQELSQKVLQEEIFQDPANENKFYDFGIREQISKNYHFEVQTLSDYASEINYKEIDRLYVSAGAAIGSAAVGGILLGGLSGAVDLPLVVIIAGAVLAGLAGGGVTYTTVVPNLNKSRYTDVVHSFMKELETSLLGWVDKVETFYYQKVEELKATL